MKIQNVIFNDIEYTLVDIYELDNNKIYHFLSDDDEFFCTKTAKGEYEVIKDKEKIERIKEENQLIVPDILFSNPIGKIIERLNKIENITPLDEETRANIIAEAQAQLGGIIDVGEKLKGTNFYLAELDNAGGEALYNPVSKSIFYQKSICTDTYNQKRIRLHEIIHALQKRHVDSSYKGLIEGATEDAVERRFEDKRSSLIGNIEFNLSYQCAYKEQVAIIRQMKAALGEDVDEEFLDLRGGFFKDFKAKYGSDLFRFILHRTTKLLGGNFYGKYLYDSKDKAIKVLTVHDEEGEKYFEETQNTILERVFDRDFENVGSLEDACAYFEKLRRFELTRGRLEGSVFFEQYYNEKLNKVKGLLTEKGIDSSKLEEGLEKYKYERQEFNPSRTKEEIESFIEDFGAYEITYMAIEAWNSHNNEKIRYSLGDAQKSIKFFCVEDSQQDGSFTFLVEIEGQPLVIKTVDKYKDDRVNEKLTWDKMYDVAYLQENVLIKNIEQGSYSYTIPGTTETIELKEMGMEQSTLYEWTSDNFRWITNNKQAIDNARANGFEGDSKQILEKILSQVQKATAERRVEEGEIETLSSTKKQLVSEIGKTELELEEMAQAGKDLGTRTNGLEEK